jgi:hypothetical protein
MMTDVLPKRKTDMTAHLRRLGIWSFAKMGIVRMKTYMSNKTFCHSNQCESGDVCKGAMYDHRWSEQHKRPIHAFGSHTSESPYRR